MTMRQRKLFFALLVLTPPESLLSYQSTVSCLNSLLYGLRSIAM
jgi:hypothetical protein